MEKMKEVEMTKEEYYEKREKISRSVSDYGETVVDFFWTS